MLSRLHPFAGRRPRPNARHSGPLARPRRLGGQTALLAIALGAAGTGALTEIITVNNRIVVTRTEIDRLRSEKAYLEAFIGGLEGTWGRLSARDSVVRAGRARARPRHRRGARGGRRGHGRRRRGRPFRLAAGARHGRRRGRGGRGRGAGASAVKQRAGGRLFHLQIAAVGGGLILLARLVAVQLVGHAEYLALAQAQWRHREELAPERGNIYDRNGRPLALSATTWRVGVAVSQARRPEALAGRLARCLPVDSARIVARIRAPRGGHFVVEGRRCCAAARSTRCARRTGSRWSRSATASTRSTAPAPR